jgi:DNA repair exonuclease SbcCD ATPase subunit
MKILKIKAKNFKLFKDIDLSLESINLIVGENKDDLKNSSNGSGKTSILEMILFGLFGEVTDINLKDLVRIGTKEAEVVIVLSHNNKNIIISRKIPAALSIKEEGKEIQFNTATLAQKYLNELFGADFLHYRTYNLIDNKKGINLLDLGITPLRKSLMDFVNAQFITIRQSLLAKKLERETYNVNKRLYTFYLSTKRQTLLETGLLRLQEELTSAKKVYEDQYKVVNNYKSEVSSREKIIYYKNQELKKVDEGICPVLKVKCEKITPKNKSSNLGMTKEIDIIKGEITEITNLLQSEESCMKHDNDLYEFTQKRVQRTKECLMKLKEAQKFAAYKYTKEDVQLYADSIKILDSFSSYYITEWLSNLEVIINDLLKGLNLSVEFSVEKDFIKINNAEQVLNYSQLSSGQKKFLGTIFKIGILLQEGIHEGVLLFDEGLGDIDSVNFYKLIEILKGLNFQNIIIYQNVDKSISDVNFINVERKEGTSTIK